MTYYKIIFEKTSNHNSYGVKMTKEKTFNNISNNYDDIKTLVNTCNINKVDFDHFEDVLENFLEDRRTF